MWLRAETGNRAYFPDASGSSFELPADVAWDVRSLVVEGQPLKAPASTSGPTIATPSAGASIPGPSRQTPFTATKRLSSVVNVKLVQAVMSRQPSGKPSFNRLGQIFVDVTEATANVTHIKLVIQQKWGHDYTLVTADGLELEDCQGTQGQDYANISLIQNVYIAISFQVVEVSLGV